LLVLENLGEKRRTVGVDLRDQLASARCDVRITVDLPVRMLERNADFGAAVLEDVYLPDAGQ